MKQSTIASAQCSLESIWVWFHKTERVNKRIISVDGIELLTEALNSDKPLVLTGPHLGNWEILLNWIAKTTQCSIAFKEPKQKKLAPIIKAAREKAGVELIPGNKEGLRRMFEVLESKGTFVILSDQKPGKKGGVFAPFFGIPAYTMTILHTLVKRSEANLIYFYAKRESKGFSVKISKPKFDYVQADDSVTFATGANYTLECLIKEAPEQFEWSYRRFRPQPDGPTLIYENLP